MKTIFFCIILQLYALLAASQAIRQSLNPLLTVIGTYTQQHADAFSFSANQAALANADQTEAGIYAERRFMLTDLGWYRAVVVMPTKTGNFGMKGTYFGSVHAKEMELGLAYGRKLSDKIAIGAQFNYYTLHVPQYSSFGTMSIEAGILLKISEQLLAGLHVYNPNNSALGKQGEKLPAIYTIGLGFVAGEQVAIAAEIEKTENEKLNLNAGLSYNFHKKLYAKAGFSAVNTLLNIGVGVGLEGMRIEMLSSFHQQLGITPGIKLLFHKKKQSS